MKSLFISPPSTTTVKAGILIAGGETFITNLSVKIAHALEAMETLHRGAS